ncbi:hypothetical protein QUA43_26770 [Microcoleus sp. N9_B4]|uniref:hypothetical protein n=1 Tax=Microcoleus sp. N9_B4 TaxID=3055386 RepID=UPI002FD5FA29
MGGWWGAVSSGFNGWVVGGGAVSHGFGSGFNGWVVSWWWLLARDLVADLTDGWLVGGD